MIIKAQKGRGTKIHILLDDEYRVTTNCDFWAENYIADGTDISDAEWEELLRKINLRKALNKCADLLSRRDHSVKELKTKLLKTVDEASADKAIEKFIEYGYLDDEKFAFAYAEHLFSGKKYSAVRVRQELYAKGISTEIIQNVIEANCVDPVDSITEIINKSYLRKLREENGRDKVIAALARRGFSYSDIKSALNKILNEE